MPRRWVAIPSAAILVAMGLALALRGPARAQGGGRIELDLNVKAVWCDICKKRITGDVITLENGYQICSECNKLPRCALCGLPALVAHPVHDEVVCDICFRTAQKCARCRLPITGNYEVFGDGKAYCETCLDDPEGLHCAVCGLPMSEAFHVVPADARDPLAKDQPLCERCYNERPKCAACGELIVGTEYAFPDHSGQFCATCTAWGPFCPVCLAPVEKARIGTAKRPLCARCDERARTTTAADVDSLFALVRAALAGSVGMTVSHAVWVQAVDAEAMEAIHRSAGQERTFAGTSARVLPGYFAREGEAFTIYVLRGQSHEQLVRALAHEYGHAWFAEQGRVGVPDVAQEGLSEWAALKALEAIGMKDERRRMFGRTDVYGQGLAQMMALEKQGGAGAVLATFAGR